MNRPGRLDERLTHVPLFRGLSKRQLHTVRYLCTCIDCQPGTVLTHEGQPGAEFIIILEGTVELRASNRVLATRGPGDYLGVLPMLSGQPHTVTSITTTAALIQVLSRREFSSLLWAVPAVSERLHTSAKNRGNGLEQADWDLTLAS
jgi:CRP-like cAMP-binding protein